MKYHEAVSQLSALLVILLSCTFSEAARHSKLERCYKNITKLPDQTGSSSIADQRCEKERYCLNIKLPYGTTIVPDYLSKEVGLIRHDELHRYLQRWSELRHLPKCWQDLELILCSMFMPQCNENSETLKITRISKPSADSCHDLRSNNHCKFIDRHYSWNSFTIFNCSDTRLYSSNCTDELRDEKIYSPVANCRYPLVVSNDTSTWFKDISGCALHCKYPILDPKDQTNLHTFIRILCSLGLVGTLFAILLFWVNRTKSSREPSRINPVILRCTICHAFSYLGWSIQMIWGTNIACSESGSNLYGLPLVANACVVSFFLTYLPSLAYLIWCACLAKLCHEKLNGKRMKVTERTFNLLSYGVPTGVLVAVAFVGQIDGHGLYGICTIGQRSIPLKTIFILLPNFIGTGYSNFYFFMTILKAMLMKKLAPASRREFYRIMYIAIFSTLQVILSFVNFMYQLSNQEQWHESIDNHMKCSLQPPRNINDLEDRQPDCSLATNPLIILYYLELLSTFAVGIIVSSWAYTEQNLRGLRRYLIEILEDEKLRQSENYTPNFETNGRNSQASQSSLGNGSNPTHLSNRASLQSIPIQMSRAVSEYSIKPIARPSFSQIRTEELLFKTLVENLYHYIFMIKRNLPPADYLSVDTEENGEKCVEWLEAHPELKEALVNLAGHPYACRLIKDGPVILRDFLGYLMQPHIKERRCKDERWNEVDLRLYTFLVSTHELAPPEIKELQQSPLMKDQKLDLPDGCLNLVAYLWELPQHTS